LVAQERTVKIGLLTFESGSAAAEGQEQIRGAQIAIDALNQDPSNKYKFEIVVGDVREQSTEAVVSAFERLKGDPQVEVMLGVYPSTTNFEIEYMAEAGMLYLIGGNAEQTREIIEPNPEKFPTVWSLAPSYKDYGLVPPHRLEAMSKQGVFKLGNKKVAIVSADNAWSMAMYTDMKPEFQKLGWTITVDEVVPAAEISDWRPILSKIRQDPPDAIMYIDYAVNNAAAFQNQFMQNPTPSLMISVYPPSVPEYRELTKEKSNGVLADIMMYPVQYKGYDAWPNFQKQFKDRFGVETGSQGAVMYELVMLYNDALKQVGDPENRVALGEAVSKIEKETMFGHLKFNPKNHLAFSGEDGLPLQFLQVWDGAIYTFWPEKYANGQFRAPPWMK
jgi:branched-chain amino acid transport system substrate-binding protein